MPPTPTPTRWKESKRDKEIDGKFNPKDPILDQMNCFVALNLELSHCNCWNLLECSMGILYGHRSGPGDLGLWREGGWGPWSGTGTSHTGIRTSVGHPKDAALASHTCRIQKHLYISIYGFKSGSMQNVSEVQTLRAKFPGFRLWLLCPQTLWHWESRVGFLSLHFSTSKYWQTFINTNKAMRVKKCISSAHSP